MRSNRAPANGSPEFNACIPDGACYNVTANSSWTFVAAVGHGVSAISPMGNTTFYVGAESEPIFAGTAARTCCGMSFDRIGWPGPGASNQGPGLLASATGWNVALSEADIKSVYHETKLSFGY